jgi:RNA polymerase sigma factor (sigma-70 family)
MSDPEAGAELGDRPDLAMQDPKESFARLFDAHARPLRGYLAGRVGEHVADDLVAETFLVALRRRASYDPGLAPIRGWLYGIATNLLRNHVRHEVRGFQATARARGDVGSAEAHDSMVVARVDAETRMRSVAGALTALSEEERDVLLLTSWAGLEPAEVASALGIPASTVRSRLHRVRHKLRAQLQPVPTEENPDA